MKIKDLMIPDPITIAKSAAIKEAIAVMKTNSIRHLPVITRGKRFTGMVTLADLKQGLIPSMVAGGHVDGPYDQGHHYRVAGQ